ncbi:17302_t:CDS:2, partial [Cetraspora pellucida]
MYTSAYFDITPPSQYSFLGFYQYRSNQNDFTFSFQKEANTLKKNLETILNNNSNSEIIEGVKVLKEKFGYENLLAVLRTPTTTAGFLCVARFMILRNHRAKFREVDKFWNNIENEYMNEELNTEEKGLQLDELRMARVIAQGASKATATVMENVDAKL